jgi:predicted lysophospholipase L1 biosynthesis ABC-type transport system permease subunit
MQQSGQVKTLLVAALGASCGAVLGMVLLFGVALAIQTMAPLDTPPDFYLPVGIAIGAPLGAALAVYGLRRRQRQLKAS